jgi:hypothetical protein
MDGLASADIVQMRIMTVRKPEGNEVDDLGALDISKDEMVDWTEPSSSSKQPETETDRDEITILESPPISQVFSRGTSADSDFTQSVREDAKRQQEALDGWTLTDATTEARFIWPTKPAINETSRIFGGGISTLGLHQEVQSRVLHAATQ